MNEGLEYPQGWGGLFWGLVLLPIATHETVILGPLINILSLMFPSGYITVIIAIIIIIVITITITIIIIIIVIIKRTSQGDYTRHGGSRHLDNGFVPPISGHEVRLLPYAFGELGVPTWALLIMDRLLPGPQKGPK